MRSLIVFIVTAVALLGSACTFEPGAPWGWIDAQLQIEEIADSGDITITDQQLHVATIQLRAAGSSGGSVADFDPANPPPGYSLCHQGHCHSDDGRTVSYEEIRAGAGAGTTSATNVATAEVDEHLDLNSDTVVTEELRVLDQVSIDRTAVTVDELFIEAEFDDGTESYDLEITLSLATRIFETGVFYDVGRTSPERQQMSLELVWPDDLFKDLETLDDTIAQSDGSLIEVHGTSNRTLRDELIARIGADAELIWLENGR